MEMSCWSQSGNDRTTFQDFSSTLTELLQVRSKVVVVVVVVHYHYNLSTEMSIHSKRIA